MEVRNFDFIIVGGGLGGSLLLAALRNRHPHLKVFLIEQSAELAGHRTWGFHEGDLPSKSKAWLLPYLRKTWNQYSVHFPEYSRSFRSPYYGLESRVLREKLELIAPDCYVLNETVTDFQIQDRVRLTLRSGTQLEAETVVLARGWEKPQGSVAWKKHVGLELELSEPHGLSEVTLIDAREAQIDGFRFFSILPWDETHIWIEDTYFSHHAILKDDRIEQEILAYVERRGWKTKAILRRDTVVVPLPIHKTQSPSKIPLPRVGAESGVFHPITGDTLPTLIMQLEAIVDQSNLTIPSIQRQLAKVEVKVRQKQRAYQVLNRMMFEAAEPRQRYQVMAHFYRMPRAVIRRFYSGQTNWIDRVRMLIARPPVPIAKALKALRQPGS